MGTTPIEGMRFPDYPQVAAGPDDFNKATYDLDGNFTTVDTSRTNALYRPRACVRNTSITGNAAKGTWTNAVYDVSVFDTPGGMTNLGLHNDRLTIAVPGLYLVYFGWAISISNNLGAGGGVIHGIAKNTTALGSCATPNFAGNGRTIQFDADFWFGSVWYAWQMNPGDFVVGGLWWNGAPAGPMQTFVAELMAVRLSG